MIKLDCAKSLRKPSRGDIKLYRVVFNPLSKQLVSACTLKEEKFDACSPQSAGRDAEY